MKVKVISVFRDKFTGKYYTPGEVIEVGEEARVLDMESRRLAERLEVKAPTLLQNFCALISSMSAAENVLLRPLKELTILIRLETIR